MRLSISALLIWLALASTAPAQITAGCINQKAAQIVARGLRVAEIPVAARMIAEDLCLHTAQDAIDGARDDVSAGQAEAQTWAIKFLTQLARKALLKKMGLTD